MKHGKTSFFERLTGSTDAIDKEKEDASFDTTEDTVLSSRQEEAELAVDMYQTPSEIILKTMVAGVKPEDLQVSIGRDMVTIKGSRSLQHEIHEKDFFAKELYWGSFTRTIMLPAEVDADSADAIEKHGLLTIKMPKIEKDKTKNLKVKSM
jgi:HSP20 family protein